MSRDPRAIAPDCPYFGRSFVVRRPHPGVMLAAGDVVRFVGPASMHGVIVGRGHLTAWFPLANLELLPEGPNMEVELAPVPNPRADKAANITWAVAMLIGLGLGFLLFRSPAGPARQAARGELIEPIARRDTWCLPELGDLPMATPTPDGKSLVVPLPDGTEGVFPYRGPAAMAVGRLRKIQAALGEPRLGTVPGTPEDLIEEARLDLEVLIGDLQRGRIELP